MQHVADHATLAGDRLQRQEADSRHALAVEAAVAAAEQLVAAADGERRRAAGDRLAESRSLPGEIVRHEELLAILPAADVVEVVVAGHDRIAHSQRRDLELVTSPAGAPREHGDVAAVGVDVEVVRVEVADPNRRHPARSQ